MEDIHNFRIFNRLKSIYRFNSVDDRKESSAEHSWSSIMLADFFLTQLDLIRPDHGINRLKVYELLMYHDVIEIESGDTPLHPEIKTVDKNEKEKVAFELLKEDLPSCLKEKYISLFHEFENRDTKEAKFAKAVDALDAEIHELDYLEDWKGWTKDFLVEKKLHLLTDFPELEEAFKKHLIYLEDNDYFSQ